MTKYEKQAKEFLTEEHKHCCLKDWDNPCTNFARGARRFAEWLDTHDQKEHQHCWEVDDNWKGCCSICGEFKHDQKACEPDTVDPGSKTFGPSPTEIEELNVSKFHPVDEREVRVKLNSVLRQVNLNTKKINK